MRRTLIPPTSIGGRSRSYRCRLERLESRSMMAADVVDAAIDILAEEAPVTNQLEELPVDEWQVCDLPACDPQPCEPVDAMPLDVAPLVDPMIIDDSVPMDDVTPPMVFDPIDIRVQLVASETEPGWAVYYYSVGADGVVQGVSVVASYDEPTIAAFVAEYADDPAMQICDYGDGWWIGGFPTELAPPVPEYDLFSIFYGGGLASSDGCSDSVTADVSGGVDVVSDWSWEGSGGVYAWDQGTDAGVDWTSTRDESGALGTVDRSGNDWTGGDVTVTPLFYARGAGTSGSFADEVAASSLPAEPTDAAQAVALQADDVAVADPVAVDPRSAAFADMRMMAAAATATQPGSVDAAPIGGGRRRR